MDCKHENKFLKTVNNRLFCTNCGAELPVELLTGEKKKEPTKKRSPKNKEIIEFK